MSAISTKLQYPPPPRKPKSLAFGACLATAWLALVPFEQSQAQLYIDVYQSRDNANNTLWVFSGSSTTAQLWSVRRASSGNANFSRRDTWKLQDNDGNMYAANAPNNQHLSLSSITGQNAVTSRDRWYVANVLTNLTTDTDPTISLTTGSDPSRSRSISHLFMEDDYSSGTINRDELGIRVSGGSFTYQANDASAWSGAGILAKPFSEFETGSTDGTFTFNNYHTSGLDALSGPRFGASSQGSVQVRFHRGTIIPEPQEYALVFGLFALGFVFYHRR